MFRWSKKLVIRMNTKEGADKLKEHLAKIDVPYKLSVKEHYICAGGLFGDFYETNYLFYIDDKYLDVLALESL